MKARVLNNFEDKYMKIIHKKNEIIDVSEERFEEINSTSFGILVEEIAKKKKTNKKAGVNNDTP